MSCSCTMIFRRLQGERSGEEEEESRERRQSGKNLNLRKFTREFYFQRQNREVSTGRCREGLETAEEGEPKSRNEILPSTNCLGYGAK